MLLEALAKCSNPYNHPGVSQADGIRAFANTVKAHGGHVLKRCVENVAVWKW